MASGITKENKKTAPFTEESWLLKQKKKKDCFASLTAFLQWKSCVHAISFLYFVWLVSLFLCKFAKYGCTNFKQSMEREYHSR